MEKSQLEAKAQEFIEALQTLERGSVDEVNVLAALFDDEATFNNSALDNKEQTLEGRDAILRFWTQYKEELGEVISEFHHVTFNDNAAGLFWETSGIHSSGETINYHGATLLKYNSTGKIIHFRGYYDTRKLVVKTE